MSKLKQVATVVVAAASLVAASCQSTTAPCVHSSGQEPLTTPIAGESNQNPCYSPDGSILVFTRFDNGYNAGPAHLFMLDLDEEGAEPRQLTFGDYDDVNVPFGCFDQETDRVVFASDREEANDFWTVAPDPDAPDLRRVTNHGDLPVWIEPVFSPDGDQIAFELDANDSGDEELLHAQVAIVDVASGDVEVLTNVDASQDDRLPSWSPDGERILYQHRDPSREESLDTWEAYIISLDTREVLDLSATIEHEGGESVPDTDLSWTHDGRYVLSSANHGGIEHPNIFMLPVSGGAMIRATHDPDHEHGAACGSPDGAWIAFEAHRTSDESSPSDIWRVETPESAR